MSKIENREKEKYRFRNKEGKIQVQKLVNDKWISRTLPSPEEVFLWLCPSIVSENTQENKQKSVQRCAHYLLTVPQKEDTKEYSDKFFEDLGLNKPIKKLTEEEKKKAWELAQ